jgi:hypothetical protein
MPVAGTLLKAARPIPLPDQPLWAGPIVPLSGVPGDNPEYRAPTDADRFAAHSHHPRHPFFAVAGDPEILAVFEVQSGIEVGRRTEYEID